MRVSLGLSFHDDSSLVEAVSDLRFEAADTIPGTGSTSLDGSSCTEPHDPNAILEMTSIEDRRDGDMGGDDSDDIQTV